VVYEARSNRIHPDVHLDAWEKRFHVPTPAGGIDVVTLPGVFSHGRLDEGTAFLLSHLPARVEGAVLDFGCGSGVIGASLKSANPGCDVTLVDSNACALLAAERTFRVNGLAVAEIRAVDGIDSVGDRTFDLIVTNPPFHQGIGTDYAVVGRFLESCEQRLNPGGVLLMVANRFLPYERMIPKGLQVSLVAENAKYKVLRGKRTAPPRPARQRD
jgi:16S rRNA (guanine1207-N2)-methyltransferase